jgi:Spy/CpxP family protein refolding chaperone
MKKYVSLLLIIVLVSGFSTFALAWGGKTGPGNARGLVEVKRFESMEELLKEELDLTEEQVDRLKEYREEYSDKLEELRDELWDRQEELHDLYFDKSKESEEVIKVQSEINLLRIKMTKHTNELRLLVRNVLTEEQLEELEDLYFGHGRRMIRFNQEGNRGFKFGGF